MLSDENHYKILRLIEQNPQISQRALAHELGISLGKANYCLKALIEKGVLKASNFRNSKNKKAYLYKLTPQGIEQKSLMTLRFLKRKREEYESLKQEIEQLQREADLDESHEK